MPICAGKAMGRIRPIAKQHEPRRSARQPIDATPELGTLAMARPLLFVNLLLAFAAHAALAQEVRVYRADETVDPQEVARILDTKPAPQIKMRSLHVLDDEPAAKASPKATGSRAAHKDALSLPIQFAFNSAEVAPSARGQLDAPHGLNRLRSLQQRALAAPRQCGDALPRCTAAHRARSAARRGPGPKRPAAGTRPEVRGKPPRPVPGRVT
jgi:hypothetical protein